jgi:succinyl-diaminopimelate desuccinylase
VRAILDRHGLDYVLDWSLSGKPFLTARGRLVETLTLAVERVTGQRPQLSTAGGTSDGRFIAEICTEIVELGPVNASIHKLNEHIAIADLDALSKIYQRALTDLLNAR